MTLTDQVPSGGRVMQSAVRTNDALATPEAADRAAGQTYLPLQNPGNSGVVTSVFSPGATAAQTTSDTTVAQSTDGNETVATRTVRTRRRQNPLTSIFGSNGGGYGGDTSLAGLMADSGYPTTPLDAGDSSAAAAPVSTGPNIPLILLVLAIAAGAVWWFFFRHKKKGGSP